MSWRHPAHNSRSPAAANAQLPTNRFPRWVLGINFGHLARSQRLEKSPGLFAVEQRVARLDAKEKPVARSERKSRHVEDRMVRRGQSIHGQHPDTAAAAANKIVNSNV